VSPSDVRSDGHARERDRVRAAHGEPWLRILWASDHVVIPDSIESRYPYDMVGIYETFAREIRSKV
jgi:hypothetical protein